MIFVDTNYFLRFLLGDVKKQHQQAKKLFLKGAEGKIKLFTSLIVMFEIYWVLSSFYQRKKEEIIKTFNKIFELKFINVENKELFQEALKIYKKVNLQFEDCYNLALMRKEKIKELKTFDQKLQKYFSSTKIKN